MSNANELLRQAYAEFDGKRILGGCDYCDAYQTLEPVLAGVWSVRIYHDSWCPFLRRYLSRQERRAKR
jgi:hypothetical protein